jgi:hypothetical protein
MPSLPVVGGSSGTWGTELNTWLLTAHNADGTLKDISQNSRTASYTLVLSDSGKIVEMNVASGNTLTVPPNSSVAFPIGTLIGVDQMGAGQTTITPGAGVTIRSSGALTKIKGQYSSVSLRKRATDEWVLVGDVVA